MAFTTPAASSLNSIQAGGTTISVGPVSTGAAGSLVLIWVTHSDSGTAFASEVEDDLFNAFTKLGEYTISLEAQIISLWAYENHDGGSRTFTATFNESIGDRSIHVSVWPGAATSGSFGAISAGTQGNNATVTSGSITPSLPDCLVIGFVSDISGENNGINSPATSLTDTTTGYNTRSGYVVQTTAEARAITWTHPAASDYGGLVAWFKPPQNTFTLPAGQAEGEVPKQQRLAA